MNNNEFNNQENTENYSSQDAGIELLHRVIESNKAVEISGKAIFHMYCDIKEDVKKIQALAHEENLKRQELLKSIPNNIIAELSPDVIKHLEKFHQKSDPVKYWFFEILAILLVAFFTFNSNCLSRKKLVPRKHPHQDRGSRGNPGGDQG